MSTIINVLNTSAQFVNQCWEGIKNNKKAVGMVATVTVGLVTAVALGLIMKSNQDGLNRMEKAFNSVREETTKSGGLRILSSQGEASSFLSMQYGSKNGKLVYCLGQEKHELRFDLGVVDLPQEGYRSILSVNFLGVSEKIARFIRNVTLNGSDLFSSFGYGFVVNENKISLKPGDTVDVQVFICRGQESYLGNSYQKVWKWYNS